MRLHTRIDLASGMHHFNMNLDPVTGLKLHNQLRAATETLFHTTTPDDCPTDPVEKQAFLRAHALLHIINGHGTHLNRPEIIVVIDTTTDSSGTGNSDGSDNSTGGGQGPVIDWGLPVEIPNAVLRDLFHRSDTHPIIIGNGTILHAPGELDLARSTRLANAHNAAPSKPSTPPAPSPTAPPTTTTAPSTTSPGGATAATPTSTTSSPCAPNTTTKSTTTTGPSTSTTTAPSPSPTPTRNLSIGSCRKSSRLFGLMAC